MDDFDMLQCEDIYADITYENIIDAIEFGVDFEI